ncbi:SDR family oxidoreductase [soil metagenome]
MRIVITGGSGFLGDRLTAELLARGELGEPIAEIVVVDRVAPRSNDPRVRSVLGDLDELLARPAGSDGHPLTGADLVFHLAAVVSSDAERDFDLGMRVNLSSTIGLLDACRAMPVAPRLVFASSLAVFGATPRQPLPDVVTDTTLPTPQSSYGTQKFIGEQLVADYARRGFVRGRSVRLMTVAVRPGVPNGAASSFLSGIIREPLAGIRSSSPVPASTSVALSSPARTIEGLITAATATDEEWGPLTAMNLPSITVTVGEMVDALARVAGEDVAGLVDWTPDPAIAAIVTTWPARFDAARARALGLEPDPDFDAIIRGYIAGLQEQQ